MGKHTVPKCGVFFPFNNRTEAASYWCLSCHPERKMMPSLHSLAVWLSVKRGTWKASPHWGGGLNGGCLEENRTKWRNVILGFWNNFQLLYINTWKYTVLSFSLSCLFPSPFPSHSFPESSTSMEAYDLLPDTELNPPIRTNIIAVPQSDPHQVWVLQKFFTCFCWFQPFPL